MPRIDRSHRAGSIAVAVVVVAVVVVSCDRSSPAAKAPTTASSTPTPVASAGSATERVDRAAVEVAYRRYWVLSRVFDQQYPESQWRRVLGEVVAEPHLSLVLARARTQHRDGIKLYGQVIPRPTVLPINGAVVATVRDCQDASRAGQADAVTGRPRTVGVPRNSVLATLHRGPDDAWRMYSIDYPGTKC